jgi:hypothetical protein
MQDLDMESAALEEAIKLYKNLWAASSCKMTDCDDDYDECYAGIVALLTEKG